MTEIANEKPMTEAERRGELERFDLMLRNWIVRHGRKDKRLFHQFAREALLNDPRLFAAVSWEPLTEVWHESIAQSDKRAARGIFDDDDTVDIGDGRCVMRCFLTPETLRKRIAVLEARPDLGTVEIEWCRRRLEEIEEGALR